MLYSLYDWQLAAFAPMRTMAVAGRNFLTNPDFPFTESRFFPRRRRKLRVVRTRHPAL